VPGFPFAVNAAEVATPLEFVVAVLVVVPPVKVPLAPELGAANVTVTPLVGAPFVVTVATRLAVKPVLTAALCDDPLVAAITGLTGGVVLEPPPHPVKITRTRKLSARMLA
jgi:hypothetical protein